MTNGRERPGVVAISKHEPLPPLRADVRTVAWWLVVGFTVGVSWAGSSEASAVEA